MPMLCRAFYELKAWDDEKFKEYAYVYAGEIPFADLNVFSLSRPLLEMYSLEIENKSADIGNFYGTIKVEDSLTHHQYIFSRDSNNPFKCRPNVKEIVKLIAPADAISASCSFKIEFNLMDGDGDGDGDEVIDELFSWDFNRRCNFYNEPMSLEIRGKKATAYIDYAVYGAARVAKVEVAFVHGDGDKPKNVSGTLIAFISLIDKKIELFNEDKGLPVRSQECIPLCRSQVIVDVLSQLTIEPNLNVVCPHNSSLPNFVKEQLLFPAKCSGEVIQNIEGPYGKFVVKVTWLSEWE